MTAPQALKDGLGSSIEQEGKATVHPNCTIHPIKLPLFHITCIFKFDTRSEALLVYGMWNHTDRCVSTPGPPNSTIFLTCGWAIGQFCSGTSRSSRSTAA